MIKGMMRIELRNVNSGELEVIEEENMLTKALQYVLDPVGYIKPGSVMYASDFGPFYKTLTGGLLLLNKSVEEDADVIFVPEGTKQTGCAVYDKQNSSGQTLRGNYNATESEVDVDKRMVKYVYDFDTAEGNGTIACVGLTHAQGGYSLGGVSVAPTRASYPFFLGIAVANLRYTGNSSLVKGCDRTYGYSSYGTSFRWLLKIDANKDRVYYFSILGTKSIQVRVYRANISSVSLWDSPRELRTLVETHDITLDTEINQQYFSYNYDDETDKFFVMSASTYYVRSSGDFVITEIDMANGYAVKQYSMVNNIGEDMRLSYLRGSGFSLEGVTDLCWRWCCLWQWTM